MALVGRAVLGLGAWLVELGVLPLKLCLPLDTCGLLTGLYLLTFSELCSSSVTIVIVTGITVSKVSEVSTTTFRLWFI